MGGTCKMSYRVVPIGSRLAEETAEEHNLTKEQSKKIKEIYAKFLKEIDGDIQLDGEEGDDNDQPASLISSSIIAS